MSLLISCVFTRAEYHANGLKTEIKTHCVSRDYENELGHFLMWPLCSHKRL